MLAKTGAIITGEGQFLSEAQLQLALTCKCFVGAGVLFTYNREAQMRFTGQRADETPDDT